jgi:hypothetical protein
MKKTKATIWCIALCLATALPLKSATYQQAVSVAHKRHVIQGYIEPNTPGAPGVQANPRLVEAVTDPSAKTGDGRLDLNKAVYIRFYDQSRQSSPSAVLILLPDEDAGAGSLRTISTEVVRATGGKIEVWAIDRRANLLENLEPLATALNAKTTEACVAAARSYRSERGGLLAREPALVAGFMSEWGLDVHMRDLKAVVEEARKVSPNIYMGGHSIGAVMAQMFAGYDFGDVTGHTLLKGLVLIEGTSNPTTIASIIPGARAPISDDEYLNGTKEIAGLLPLRGGTTPPFIASRPAMYQMIELGAQITLLEPEGTTLQTIFPPIVNVPATNGAFMGIFLDNDFQAMPIARVSMGFLQAPQGVTAAAVATRKGDDPARANPTGLWTPVSAGPQQPLRWASSATAPSSQARAAGPEVSSLEATMRQSLMIGSAMGEQTSTDDTNTSEWYFPQRLRTDISKVIHLGNPPLSAQVTQAQRERKGNPITLTRNNQVNLDVLAIRASQGGFLNSDAPFQNYLASTRATRSKLKTFSMLRYAHSDVLISLARTSRPGNRNVPELIADFVSQNR